MIIGLYLRGKINSVGETVIIEEKDDMTVEEFFKDSYEMKELVPLEPEESSSSSSESSEETSE